MSSSAQSQAVKPRPNARMRACLRIPEDAYDMVLERIRRKLPPGYHIIRTNTVDKTDHRWAYVVGPTYAEKPKDPGLILNKKQITEWVIPPGWPPHWVIEPVPFALSPIRRRSAPKVDYISLGRGPKTTRPRMLALIGIPAHSLDKGLSRLAELLPKEHRLAETGVEDKKGLVWVLVQGPLVRPKAKPAPFIWENREITAPVEVGATPPCWLAEVDTTLQLERLPIEDLPDQPFKISNKT